MWLNYKTLTILFLLTETKGPDVQSQTELAKIFAKISDPDEMETFLTEMLTDSERSALWLRWQLLKELYNGETQRSIAERHHISLCKITRGSKILKQNNSAVVKILKDKFGERK